MRGKSFAMIEKLSTFVTLESFFRSEIVHAFNVTPIRAHVTKHFVATKTFDALRSLLRHGKRVRQF